MDENPNQLIIKQKSSVKYKDTLFRTLFREKDRAIELCNAVAGTDYSNDVSVIMCDMENALLRRYNDLAFAVEGQLIVMCEHQSTLNPNMPLRFLPYITDMLYSWFVSTNEIYKSTLLKIPTPQFYVLYNGKEELKYDALKLSDSFKLKPSASSMELTVKVLNVNHGSGSDVFGKSAALDGYAYLIAQIRNIESAGYTRDKAIKDGIKKCIDEGILADFLRENYEEVSAMLVWEYSQDAEFKALREEGEEKGRAEGKAEGRAEGRAEGETAKALAIAKNLLSKNLPIELIVTVTGLTRKEVENLRQQIKQNIN